MFRINLSVPSADEIRTLVELIRQVFCLSRGGVAKRVNGGKQGFSGGPDA